MNNQDYETNNWGYEVQQLNHTSSYNFISNNWQLHCPEYLNDQQNKSQFKHQNEVLLSPCLIYFIKMNKSYRAYESNDALSLNNNIKNESSHHVNISKPSHHTDVFFNDSMQSTQYDDSLYSCCSCEMPLETSENLWNHILNWHEVDTHFSITKVATQQVSYIEYILQNVVVISQLSVHEYTAVKAILFWHDTEQKMTICLDTESTTMFIDQSLVNKAKIKQTLLIMTESFFRKQVLN